MCVVVVAAASNRTAHLVDELAQAECSRRIVGIRRLVGGLRCVGNMGGRQSAIHTESVNGGTQILLLGLFSRVTGMTLVVHEQMLAEVIAAQELLLAHRAQKVAIVGMDALVALELVRAREALAARLEIAYVRSIVVVRSQVSAQMRRLVVLFGTLVALVSALLAAVGARRAVLLGARHSPSFVFYHTIVYSINYNF